MELYIAGGVGEHGRNCFFVQGETVCFLVDCGKMADTPEDPYPHLDREQILSLDAVFLTHSHADHTGAISWLHENGFRGDVIASRETFSQLAFPSENCKELDELCPCGEGKFRQLMVQWGRSGHCAGSVWYRFNENGRTILFSGDYTEDTQVYACDPIRNQSADVAVLDCAYGFDGTEYEEACERLLTETEGLLSEHHLLMLPVPKYGRGLELLKLLSEHIRGSSFYADGLFLDNLKEQGEGTFWYKDRKIDVPVEKYSGQQEGIVFVSDPQLRSDYAQRIAEHVLSLGGTAVMTGTLERGSYSDTLHRCGMMKLIRYPVHLNYTQFEKLKKKNAFSSVIPYHTKELTAEPRILF